MRLYDRIWANVDLDAVVFNMHSMEESLGNAGIDLDKVGIYGVVKADAYGHGLVPVARTLEPMVKGLAVATVDEALILRSHGIEKPVVVLSTPSPRRFPDVVLHKLQPAVYIWEHAKELSDIAVSSGSQVLIHLAVDTGMSRIGMMPTKEQADMAAAIAGLPGIQIEGVFTHFTKADEAVKDFSRVQAERFVEFLAMLKERGLHIPVRHISNSAAILELPDLTLDAVRAGISIYGLYPSGDAEKSRMKLKPVMELKSEVTYVKDIEPGTTVSYGGTFVAQQTVRVATIPVGYADGYPRNLSGKGYVLIRGKKAPILGRVCMDQMMVDVTGTEVGAGDEVTLFGHDGELEIRVEELAAIGGGFHYEIVCGIGKRVPRVYRKDGKVVACKDYFSDQFSQVVY